LQAVIAILAALNSRQATGQGQYVDVAMAATLLAVNERAHVDLSDDDIGAEPAVLGATDCSFFTGPHGEHFTVATSIVGSRTFPSWLRAMRRSDLMDDPRFSSAAARRLNFGALHQIIQSWMLTFPDMATLDAQFDEAKIAMGEIRSIKELSKSDWSDYWGAVQLVPDRSGGEYKLPGRPWHFSRDELTPIGTPAFQGEHNREVFGELGVSETELQRLSQAGVLVAHPRAVEPETAVKPTQVPGQAA
jgi:crotonobetainyl-CoA:carnitine CoA-transferase CaiB-like acyl-CoA transferase